MYGNISDWDLQYLPPKPTELTHAEKITGYENINDGEFVVTADNKVAKIWARGRNNEYLESATADFKGKVIPRYAEIDNKLVYAESFDNLLIDFAKINSVSIIIRGLRVVSDFDYEFQMAGMNKRLNSDIETVFLMASETNQFIASRFVKEVASLGGDVSSFVPKNVNNEIIKKFSLIK